MPCLPCATPATEPRFQRLRTALSDSDETVQLNAAAGLLAIGDLSALPMAEAALLRPDLSSTPEVQSLQAGIRHGVKDVMASPTLARLLASGDVETRRSVSPALRNTRSAAALKPSVGQALEDADFDVRVNAARALAEFADQPQRRLSDDGFRADEEGQIRYWKEWLAQRTQLHTR
jgi:HEAT repeat protein